MSASQVCTVDYIDHVGIAVKDIDAALEAVSRGVSARPWPRSSNWTTRAFAARWCRWDRPGWN